MRVLELLEALKLVKNKNIQVVDQDNYPVRSIDIIKGEVVINTDR